MACPYFHPTKRVFVRLWPHPARLPLGSGFEGLCRAREGEAVEPGELALRDWCNLGYAAGGCARFPAGAPDAVRFAVARDAGGLVVIHYVVEQGHRPHSHGELEYERSRRAFRHPPQDTTLARQAQVYVENYLRLSHDTQNRKGIAVGTLRAGPA